MNLQQDTVLTGARALLGTLPEADRAAVSLALVADSAEHLSPEARQALLQILPKEQSTVLAPATSTREAANLQLTQDLAAFVATYKIRAIEGESSQVAQTIPTDKTYADYLREGQALSIALHAAFPEKYKADQAIWPARLEQLLADPAFQAKGTGLETITDGCVSGTNGEGMTRAGATRKLASQGLKHENDPVLVAAHTGRYLVDATSIFQGQVVRAAGGAFRFHAGGLGASDIGDADGGNDVSSSARRAPSELKT